jgi:integrase
MAVFNENFEKKISESGELRKDFLNNTSLGELIDSTTRKDAPKVKNILTELGISDLTLGQINTDKKITQEFVNVLKNRTLDDGSDAFVKPLIQSFDEIFKEAGYIPPKGTNPVRNLIKEVLGESQAKELFDVSITRKNPLAYKTLEPYKALKKVATNLIKSDPNAGYHLLTIIQGGYRPSDFKSLRIENIDFETGEVVGLEIKDELIKAKRENRPPKLKAGYFPQDVLDTLKQAIGGRTEGLVFKNISTNSKIINKALKRENIQVSYSVEGVKKEGTLTIEDVRKMHESNLDAQGVKRGSVMRNALTLRGDKSVVGGYVATAGNIIDMEKAHLKAFSVQAITNGNSTIAQYLADVGIPEEAISSRTKKYKVTKKVFNKIPPYLQERIINENPDLRGVELADKSVSTTEFTVDPVQAEKYQELSSKKLDTQIMDETIAQAGKQDEFLAAQEKLQEGKKLQKAEKAKQILETAKTGTKEALKTASNFFKGKYGSRTLKSAALLTSGVVADKVMPILPAFSMPEAEEYLKEKLTPSVGEELAEPIAKVGKFAEFSPIAPTMIQDYEKAAGAIAKPVAQATSQYKESFLDRIRNQLSQLQN